VYAARKGIRTGVVSENFGGQTLDTLAIENYISIKMFQIFVFNVICILIATALRMYIMIAP